MSSTPTSTRYLIAPSAFHLCSSLVGTRMDSHLEGSRRRGRSAVRERKLRLSEVPQHAIELLAGLQELLEQTSAAVRVRAHELPALHQLVPPNKGRFETKLGDPDPRDAVLSLGLGDGPDVIEQ